MKLATLTALFAIQTASHPAAAQERVLTVPNEAMKDAPSGLKPTHKPPKGIPEGTVIELSLAETISTRTHVKGDTFELNVSKPLVIDGREILPTGSKIVGEVTRAETKSAFGVSGKLEARLLYAVLPTGTLRLNGKLAARGKGGTTETVLTYAAIGAIAFVVTGKSATIEKGTGLVGVIEQR